jgi:ribosomal protein L3 glutamine methyltransferase
MTDLKIPDHVQTVRDCVLWGATQFEQAGLHFGHGTDNALDEAAWLVLHALGLPLDAPEAQLDVVVDSAGRREIESLLKQRIESRKPAAYLTREAWFAGLPFYVDERVIVPRSHLGEFIEQQFTPWCEPGRVHRALDLCTGSGCIAVALAQAFPEARVDASDVSGTALEVAATNVARHGLDKRIELIESDLFSALGGRRYDLIVSNPPYVTSAAMGRLPAEYRAEPALALAGGINGLELVGRMLAQADSHMSAEGLLVVEVGDARETVEQEFPRLPFTWLTEPEEEGDVFLLHAAELTDYNK